MNKALIHKMFFNWLYFGMLFFICFKLCHYAIVTPEILRSGNWIQAGQRTLSLTLPLMLFSITELVEVKWRFRKIILPLFIFGIILTLAAFDVFLIQKAQTFRTIFGFIFEYEAAVEYLLFGIIFFELFRRKTHNDFKSFTYMVMLLSVIGLLYELPIGYADPDAYFHWSYPTFIYPRWLMAAFITWRIGLSAFCSKLVLVGLVLLGIFSYFYYLDPNMAGWIPRLPMLLFWLIPVARMKVAQTTKNEQKGGDSTQ